jgi:PPOX class probable FMN-dependent enzyme
MTAGPFSDVVTSEAELRAFLGEANDVARRKERPALDHHARAFIARSPLVLLGTADGHGRCDVSPKGDAPGFVLVLDDRHLAIPDRPGNRRLDGMRNLLENPHVGLLFLIPGKEETLRVNGRACIVRDEPLLARMAVGGKRPRCAIGVEVEEVFLHCAKAFKRSRAWDSRAWPDLTGLASGAQMFFDHARPEGMTVEQLEQRIEHGYDTQLY